MYIVRRRRSREILKTTARFLFASLHFIYAVDFLIPALTEKKSELLIALIFPGSFYKR